jgi:Zn-dependent protease
MKWSIPIGRIAGIDVKVHLTFVLLLAWVGWDYYSLRQRLDDVFAGLILITAVFGIVVLHELGHALAARRYGIATRDITLLPIGGVARLERMPEDPRQELVVALAGPAVNVALAIVLVAFLAPAAVLSTTLDFHLVGGNLLANLLMINVVLAVFNLIPAFPMDGGRVLRALLAMRKDYVRATQTAAATGQALALVFGFAGLLIPNPFLVFIALFVWLGAAEEASTVQLRIALGGIPISRAMITDYRTLAPEDPLSRAVDHVLAGFQQDFPVTDASGNLVGVLTRPELVAALAERGPDSPVGDAMTTHFLTAEPSEMADRVFARLGACRCRSLPVTHGGHLIGIVTPENVGEFVMIQSALHGGQPRAAGSGGVFAPRP